MFTATLLATSELRFGSARLGSARQEQTPLSLLFRNIVPYPVAQQRFDMSTRLLDSPRFGWFLKYGQISHRILSTRETNYVDTKVFNYTYWKLRIGGKFPVLFLSKNSLNKEVALKSFIF
jgi:hypothetical protein